MKTMTKLLSLVLLGSMCFVGCGPEEDDSVDGTEQGKGDWEDSARQWLDSDGNTGTTAIKSCKRLGVFDSAWDCSNSCEGAGQSCVPEYGRYVCCYNENYQPVARTPVQLGTTTKTNTQTASCPSNVTFVSLSTCQTSCGKCNKGCVTKANPTNSRFATYQCAN